MSNGITAIPEDAYCVGGLRCTKRPEFLISRYDEEGARLPEKAWYCRAHAEQIVRNWDMRFGWLVYDGQVSEEVFYQPESGLWETAKLGELDTNCAAVFFVEEEARAYAAAWVAEHPEHDEAKRDWWIVTDGDLDFDTFDWWEGAVMWCSDRHGAVAPYSDRLFVTAQAAIAAAVAWRVKQIDLHQDAIVKLLVKLAVANQLKAPKDVTK